LLREEIFGVCGRMSERIEGRKGDQRFLCSLSCIEQCLWALSEFYADGDCGRLFIPYSSTICDNDKIRPLPTSGGHRK
jgi:hypothetical protein